jgi:hypothetical protein
MAETAVIVDKYAFLKPIADAEKQIDKLKDTTKEAGNRGSAIKMKAYGDLIAGFAALPSRDAKTKEAITKALVKLRVTKACAKRYRENGFGALDKMSGLEDVAKDGAAAIGKFFRDRKITTESKLKADVFGKPDVIETLLKSYFRLDEKARARFMERVEEEETELGKEPLNHRKGLQDRQFGNVGRVEMASTK